jgi:diaminohydroxyphosphoribosylaminopyrimidine deaminase/5-amino-6-(5-phosphoribosylamino)uracil reductase
MSKHEAYMSRSLALAALGTPTASPNPLVGCVIVNQNDTIIGEGFHHTAGMPHAEVNAINAVKDKSVLSNATLYVNLEPCAHFGKTPPCTDLIIEYKIPRVVICNSDPYEAVAGRGIQKLREAGIEVTLGILEEEGKRLNRRFFHSVTNKRPYVTLKWARSRDGFMDIQRLNNEKGSFAISGPSARRLVHQWRTEEDAILVGHNTVIIDDPELTSRFYAGKNPVRVIIDPKGELDTSFKVFRNDAKVIVISDIKNETTSKPNPHRVFLDLTRDSVGAILDYLHHQNIRSLLVEGGRFTLQQFIISEYWNEVRIFTASKHLLSGMPSPDLGIAPSSTTTINQDILDIYYNSL